jgi:hypothetical protein
MQTPTLSFPQLLKCIAWFPFFLDIQRIAQNYEEQQDREIEEPLELSLRVPLKSRDLRRRSVVRGYMAARGGKERFSPTMKCCIAVGLHHPPYGFTE